MSEEWVPFRTKCPSCNNNEVITWEHCKGFGEKINKAAEIKCENPNCHMFSKPKFISELSFNCGQHNGEGREPNQLGVFTELGMISLIQILSKEERCNLFNRIMDYLND